MRGGSEDHVPALEPFADFGAAARAVVGWRAQLDRGSVDELLERLLATILRTEASAIEATARAERAEAQSLIDPLTGIGNRSAWLERMAVEEDRCRRHGVPVTVLVVDLDRLEQVNDARGHVAGDELLRQTAAVLVGAVRAHDVVTRTGGDEFAVMALHCRGEEAWSLAGRVRAALEGSGIDASIGVAKRDSTEDLHRAWMDADDDMYEDKRRRRLRPT